MTTATGQLSVALSDGSTVRVRRVVPEDAAGLRALLEALPPEQQWLRFFSGGANLAAAAGRAAAVDAAGGCGLVAIAGADARIVGHAELVPERSGVAEVAFEVAPDWQHHGIATLLLGHLAQAAGPLGIETFTAHVLPANHRMASVFRESGFPVHVASREGELELTMPASLTSEAHERFERRDDDAAVAAVAHVLRPASIALIGVSERPGSIGGAVLRNLRAGGYAGALHVVHPRHRTVGGVETVPDVASIPGGAELAVVAVPAASVPAVARACGAAGVRALVVLSAGFAESGPAGRALQDELLSACREWGMRLVGPNCLGVVNSDAAISLNATFAPDAPPPGRLAFGSQSGAYGIAGIAEARRRGLGLSSFVSMGDKADLSGNDLLRFWHDDPGTDVVLLYLESFGNPRRFGRIARSVAARKPVIAVKAGRSAVGGRAAGSHTGALVSASDATVDALFEHAGVIRTDTLEEMLDVAALAQGPLPRGRRVAIVTNAGGPGIACADACDGAGLDVPATSDASRERLTSFLPDAAALGNPVDLVASATPEDFARAVATVADDPGVDAIVVIVVPTLVRSPAAVAAALRGPALAATGHGTTIAGVFMAEPPEALAEHARAAALPVLRTPEEAARALGRLARYAEWRRHVDHESLPPAEAGADPEAGAAAIAGALADGGGWLAPEAVDGLLRAYGIPVVPYRRVPSPAAAGRAAATFAGPVAIKVLAPDLVHKSDAAAVRLGVRGTAAVARAASDAAAAVRRAGYAVDGFLVQPMIADGVEMIAGIVGDRDFGPIVAVGAGGRAVELLRDARIRLAPVTRSDAHDMLRELRTFPLLDGYRGAPRTDVGALEDVLVSLGALADAHPEVAELDCNPIVAGPNGVLVLDARVRVAPVAAPSAFPSLDP